jgi:hypothetical protein
VPSWLPGALRCGEIATSRAVGFVGFSPSSAPLILAAIGGAVGGTATSLIFDGFTSSTLASAR